MKLTDCYIYIYIFPTKQFKCH